MTDSLISVRSLSKAFAGPGGRPIPVLDDINLDVAEGEFVALLGRSGSGKSTLLRCIAGLIAPTDGQVLFRGQVLTGTNRDTTMVFQTFALLPWLTVQQNVEIGLEARGVATTERTERALRAIDLVGLDGYESAYPKELSGGMRAAARRVPRPARWWSSPAAAAADGRAVQRAGRADPRRTCAVSCWSCGSGQRFPTKTIVMVTHNIEEAVLLGRSDPGAGHQPRPDPDRHAQPAAPAAPPPDPGVRRAGRRDLPDDDPAGRGARGRAGRRRRPEPRHDQRHPAAAGHRRRPVRPGRGHAGPARRQRRPGRPGRQPGPGGRRPAAAGRRAGHAGQLRRAARGPARRCPRPAKVSAAGASIQDSKEMFARASVERAPLVRTIYLALRSSLDGTL